MDQLEREQRQRRGDTVRLLSISLWEAGDKASFYQENKEHFVFNNSDTERRIKIAAQGTRRRRRSNPR
jgi:hypothetical protein